MKPLFLVDLDDTLFQTERKIPRGLEKHAMASEATNGKHSWYTRHQSDLVEWLFENADVVPVTARSRESFSRCRLPVGNGAILCNGGLVLEADGSVDAEWDARIRKGAEGVRETMDLVLSEGFGLGYDVRGWIVSEADVPLYACFKSNKDEEIGCLAEIVTTLAGDDRFKDVFSFHRNGNNVGIVPHHVSKKAAVEHLLIRRGIAAAHIPVFGMGDSLSDLPFMDLCHFKVIPTGSQIDRKNLS
jgi:hypothetical protein